MVLVLSIRWYGGPFRPSRDDLVDRPASGAVTCGATDSLNFTAARFFRHNIPQPPFDQNHVEYLQDQHGYIHKEKKRLDIFRVEIVRRVVLVHEENESGKRVARDHERYEERGRIVRLVPVGRELQRDERESEHDECSEHELDGATRFDDGQGARHQHFGGDDDEFCGVVCGGGI